MNRFISCAFISGFVLASIGSIAAEPDSSFDGPGFESFIPPDVIDFSTVAELQSRMSDGSVTSMQLVQRALARIGAIDRNGPALNAVVEINPDALAIANDLDAERAEGRLRGPLHGVPVLVKDNIDTGDSMQTSSGSLALVGRPALQDAFVVQRLRQAGAIVLGKANASELAGFRDWGIPSGWSGRGGQVGNPWGTELPVCGSSAGSAAGLAAGYAPLAVGTETNGSIICPAYYNQVVGLRPTLGLLSQAGIVPLSSWQDTPGPMGRTVSDVALLLGAMQGNDERRADTPPAPGGVKDYHGKLNASSLLGKRLGYPLYRGDGSLTIDHPHFKILAGRLERAGATLLPVDMKIPPLFAEQMTVLNYGIKRDLAAYLQGRPGIEVRNLADLIAFNRNYPGEEGYGQQLLEDAQALDIGESAYWETANKLRDESRKVLDVAHHVHQLDAVIDLSGGQLQGVGAQAGYPGLQVSAGQDAARQPVGLYFLGLPWSEEVLLSMGFAFEQSAN
ncbi:Glutamyl-tRNA(Gln) amidotransferase subunit A [compost metagenome]